MSETPNEMDQGSRRFVRRLWTSFYSADSYGLVLLLIVVAYGLSVSLTQPWNTSLVLAIQIATVWFALRTSKAHRSVRLTAAVLLVWSAGVALLNVFAAPITKGTGLVALTAALLYLIAPLSIIRHLVSRRVIDVETLLGAVASYLLVGMCFAYLYRALGIIQDAAFFGGQGQGTFPQDLFFSFTTLTTTGYENLVPAANPGQSLAVLEMLIGQFFLLTAVSKVVSGWTPRRIAAAREAEE